MKHVAIIGAGISGLAAAYLLSRRYRVTLFEREPRLGGHTHTTVVDDPVVGPLALDTGFLVHNERTYPNLVRLFTELGVQTHASDMSFSVSCSATRLEYSSRGFGGFFAQPSNLLKPAHYRLLSDILRFNREAPSVLDAPGAESWTLSDYLAVHRYGDAFVSRYLVPMASAIWSASYQGIRWFPAQTLVRFMQNHGMLSVGAHPTWRVVTGGSHMYIPKLVAPLRDRVHLGARLMSVRRADDGVYVKLADTSEIHADEVVFACHGDQVLPLLADASDLERDVFSQFSTTPNQAWLHRDAGYLPTAARARASWNYRLGIDREAPPTVTYDLNRLQRLNTSTSYCVTLNPQSPIRDEDVIKRIEYRHPRYTLGSVRAQSRWTEVSGSRRTHYCGAYWRYGFHEDGLVSAIRVAQSLGVQW